MPQQVEMAPAMLSHSLGAKENVASAGTAAGGCWLTILVNNSLLKGERILTNKTGLISV